MRIIAGEFKGRPLVPPVDRTTRPMLGRVREALFSTLGSLVDEARVLDLFSGTGSLGLEALSRGAKQVVFVERDRRALTALFKNVEELGVKQRALVAPGNALDASRWGDGEIDVAFLDPPYPWFRDRDKRNSLFDALRQIFTDKLALGGALVLHTHPRDVEETDFELAGATPDKRVYGNTALWYVWKSAGDSDDSGESEESQCS